MVQLINFIKKFIFDTNRDSNSNKISQTKIIGNVFFLFLVFLLYKCISIMITKQEIDHILLGECFGFLMALLGLKNFTNKDNIETPNI